MNKSISRGKCKVDEQSWQRVLVDAQQRLDESLRRTKELRSVIKQIEVRIQAGERFPAGDRGAEVEGDDFSHG